ncbi:MAG: penicillin acylase family protein [Cyclobacteriaceae bacterium]|nr:penicillin acylase family protein [Cyclobacteriaceae bacterium]
MKILKRTLIVLLILVLAATVGGYFYVQSTAPVYEGSVTLKGLKGEVEVYYDTYGVPHIYATTLEDAYFALGYAHAQDRLFQMELARRAAGGRLAEVLGKDLVPTDKLFRTLGINQFAEAHAQKFLNADTSEFQRGALSYQKGINEYIRTGKTPIEFSIIGIPKTEFVPADIYRVIGIMAFGFAEGVQIDPMLEKIRTELGDAYLKDLAVQTPANAERIRNFKGAPPTAGTEKLISAIRQGLDKLPLPLWVGSNGWVISGDRTDSGEPILENDTHMGYAQPAVWYEAHLEFPGHRFYGHHAAGVPFGFLGNNAFCAWGLTMFENDDTDFFREEINPENPNQVKFGDQWEDLTLREEIIKVKGEEDVVVTVKTSRHGPLFNSIMEETVPSPAPVALWWGLHHQTNYALQTVYELNHATSFAQVSHAVSQMTAPGLNVMYADVEGTIAWWAAARLPIRPPHVNSKFFLDGASGKDEYLGYYDFSKNPHAINPPWGFVYSANNQPDTVDGVYYPGYYYPRSRAGRIVELLSEEKMWTPDEVRKVNLDVQSPMHRDIARTLSEVLLASGDARFTDMGRVLQEWNGDMKKEDIAPSIYFNLLSQTTYRAMIDELGWEAYQAFNNTSIARNSWEILVASEQSPWWDDIKTADKKETRTDIVIRAAEKSLALLQQHGGPNMQDWKWEKYHLLKHPHALGAVKLLDGYFSVGPFGVPGGSEVINNLHFDLDTTGIFQCDGGPALRKVTDMSDVENGMTVSPTGQSGNFLSPYYQDQAEMFVKGEVRKMMMNREEIVAKSKKLLLSPSRD